MVRDDSFYHVGGGTMKKYNTRPFDFTGCHPVIAEHLKRGEAIECLVNDSQAPRGKRRWVSAYYVDSSYPYWVGTEAFRYAEPISSKVKRIMPPERAIPALIAEGWAFNEYGNLVCPGEVISASAFRCFGRPCDDYEASARFWPPCIIEEAEDE